MSRALLLLASALLLASTSACSGDDEEDFSNTHAISALSSSYGAFADEGRLRVYAALLGPKGFVRLRGGDTFEIDIAGQRTPTTERLLDDKVHYIADVPAPPEETEVVITFVRGVHRVSSKIRIYPAFTVKTPPPRIPMNGAVEIDVDPRPDLSKWPGFFGPGLIAKAEVVADCLETGSQQIELCSASSEPGKCTQAYPLQLDATKLIPRLGKGSCRGAVQVRLTTRGSPVESEGTENEKFKGGNFEGYRLKSFETELVIE